MNAADESSPAPSLRRLPFSVRLAPHFVNCLAAVLPEDDVSDEVEGLLFGIVETGFSVLRMFHLSTPAPGVARQADFGELLARSKRNPQLAGFTPLGWFSVRTVQGLQPDDIAFHQRNFQKSNDLALIVTVEPEHELSFELYCRTVDGTFTSKKHRSGSIRISNASPQTSPLEIPMELHREVHIPNLPVAREIDEDDSFAFLREAFASSTKKTIDLLKTGKPEQREEMAASNRAVVDPAPSRKTGDSTSRPAAPSFGTYGGAAAAPAPVPQDRLQATEPADHHREQIRPNGPDDPLPTDLRKRAVAEPGTPDAIPTPSDEHQPRLAPDEGSEKPNTSSRERAPMGAQPNDTPAPSFGVKPAQSSVLSRIPTQVVRALPWRILAAIFVAVAGVTFGFIYLRSAHANGTLPQFVQAIWPTPGLDLKIAANGDRFQLSWNRNIPAVRNAREAILEINDGPNRHEISLAHSELENGSVLYLPTGDDVVFRLQVHGAAGQNATESLRVVGTAKSNVLEVSRPEDIPNSEPVPPASTIAANRMRTERARAGVPSRRASVAPKPEGVRVAESHPPAPAGPAADLGGDRIPTVNVPNTPSPTTAPAAEKREAAPGSSTPPPANTAAGSPPRTNPSESAGPAALPRSDSSASSSAEKANTTDTAQLSKPDQPIAATENNGSKSAPVQIPEPPRVSPPKTDAAGTQGPVTYSPPRPLKQVLPKITTLPPGIADSAGEVRVVVRVNESGQVIDARVVEGRNRVGSMLATAALTAARQWVFEPASLRGKNIASDHTIVFQFRH